MSAAAASRNYGIPLISLALLAPVAAHAGTAKFESLPQGIIWDQDTFSDGGLQFTAAGNGYAGVLVDGSDPGLCLGLTCATNNDSHYYAALNDSAVAVRAEAPGQLLTLKGFDASFIGAYAGDSYPLKAGLLTVSGQLAAGGFVSEQFTLAAQADGTLQFGSYLTSAGFASQAFTSLTFSAYACDLSGVCAALGDGSGQFALDNVNTSAVPEAPAWLLLLSGLSATLLAARRRQRSA